MHLQNSLSLGQSAPEIHDPSSVDEPLRQIEQQSSCLPFGRNVSLISLSGPTYVTAQTLIQQVAYSLSDKLFTYSPETFDLDISAKKWYSEGAKNIYGYTTNIASMQTRSGAGSIALGYIFSKDFDLSKRHIPQSVIASSSSLPHLRACLDQLSLLYSVASPFVAHVAAVDYLDSAASGLACDYITSMSIAEELGFGLVNSFSAYESQHMALFATLLSTILPTIHTYDGVHIGRETARVIDVLDQRNLHSAYDAILAEVCGVGKKYNDIEGKSNRLLRAFNGELGTAYEFFEYHGHAEAETALVVFGTTEASLASQIAAKLSVDGSRIGVVNVRVYRPFLEEEFLKALPATTRTIVVLGQVADQKAVSDSVTHSQLYTDVVAAVTFCGNWLTAAPVRDIKYSIDQKWCVSNLEAVFHDLCGAAISDSHHTPLHGYNPVQVLDLEVKQYSFWDLDSSPSAGMPLAIGELLSKDSKSNVTLRTVHDNLVRGGVQRTDIRTSKKTVEAPFSITEADVTFVGNEHILTDFNILNNIKQGGALIVSLPALKPEDIQKKLGHILCSRLAERNIRLYMLDTKQSSTVNKLQVAEGYLAQLAFLKVAREDLLHSSLETIVDIDGGRPFLQDLAGDLDTALLPVSFPQDLESLESPKSVILLPSNINMNSFCGLNIEETQQSLSLQNWEAAARALVFREAYDTKTRLRPDLSVKSWTVHVRENRRLTPLDYNRNIFHIEFDLGDSGLKYDIGEALGVHAENNPKEVEDFIESYGLQADDIVEVPSKDDQNNLESRTVYQALMQNVDIFGRPPKRFYEDLAGFAGNEKEKQKLLALGGPEGAIEFKRRAEVDTITYADVLLEFPSAHPKFHDLIRIISPLKRREYSIASSQKVTPTSVSLLVVVVHWVDTRGRDRFGQSTRYLSSLRPGDSLTVSVKPSVMKLPPKPTQPLIMAGLGTGLAPFRAFVQYRAWQKAQGVDIGSVLLYMGSRHQREEYLYGEEWEAYQDAGVITLLGRAFSRDQPQKIYIQDRMRQTMGDIIDAYIKLEGAFYLCGPTWPVPDVTEVLQEAISRDAATNGRKVDSKKEIEKLKESLRYVLEVY